MKERTVRRHWRALVGGLITGGLLISGAWAGVGLSPAPITASAGAVPSPAPGQRLSDGWFLAGAHKVSIAPDPERWTPHDPENGTSCGSVPAHTALTDVEGCLLTFDMNWATHVDPEHGIWVRAVALSNGEETIALATMDTVSWFYGYPAEVCADCGARAIAERVSAETGGAVAPEGIVIAASHTHASANTTSDIPAWYYEQVRDATIDALLGAVAVMEPVVLESGATPAKQYNVDRRHVTRAIPDWELNWLRAYVPAEKKTPERTVAAITNFAVHTTVLADNAMLHDGFVGPLTRTLEDRWGGTALFFPGGLGDQTVDRAFGREGMGRGMAELVLEDHARGTYRLRSNDIVVDRREIAIPIDNKVVTSLRLANYFVRDFLPPYGGGPMSAVAQRSDANRPSCVTAGATHVIVPVGGIRIGASGTERGDRGDALVIMQAPGEIFASISAITKDYLSLSRNVLVLGMANDHIGYIIPAHQFDETAQQGPGLLNNSAKLGDYEEVLSVSRCAGDLVQNALLESGAELGVMGFGEGP